MINVELFIRHYVAALLWSSLETSNEDGSEFYLDKDYGPEDIAPEAMAKIQADCAKFIAENEENILTWKGGKYSAEEMAGHDFLLTRNRHGSGFWDGDWGKDIGEKLTEASHKFREMNAYVGDDDKIYV